MPLEPRQSPQISTQCGDPLPMPCLGAVSAQIPLADRALSAPS
jgi:hypothetical protein